jgi:hypothetical protein
VRRTASTVLIVLGGLLLVPGLAALYLRVEIIDEDRFEARTVAALQADPVRRAAAEQITAELVDAGATELLAVRPLVVSALDAFAGTQVFARGVGLAARDAHSVLVEGRNESFVLDLGQTVTALLSELGSVVPAAADAVPRDIDPELFSLDPQDERVRAIRAVAAWGAAGYVLPAVAVLLLIVGVALAPRRRGALVLAGGMIAAAGGVLAIAVAFGRAAVEREAPGGFDSGVPVADALTAVYDAYVGDLRAWAVVALVVGAALALTGSEMLDPARRGSSARRLWETLARRPARPLLLGLRGLAFALVGLAVLLDPLGAVRVFGVAFGILLVVLGLGEVADALGRRVQRAGPRMGRAPAVALGIGALLAVGSTTVAAAVVTSRQAKPPAPPPVPAEGCNSSRALCGLRLDQVTFAGTHNSYSAAEEPGWLFANQRYGIERQLRDGIRLMLIDIHIGVRDGNRVRTDLQAEGVSRNKVAKALGPGAIAAAERVAGGIGAGNLTGPRELFLCHTLCELGAEPLDQELDVIRRFLDAEPGAVLVLFVEPYVSPEQVEAAFDRAGLLDHLAELDRDEPLPTLGELVDSDRRIVVFTEAGGGARPWYLPGFSFVQDTPLGATKASEFSCARNRGDANSPLLLINHWIDTFPPPPRGNARIGGPVLRRRLARCAAERKLWPSLVAVDFYDTSGVVEIAAEWNRRAR